MMADKIETMDDNTIENPSPVKVDSRTCLLDKGEDFEVLDEDDMGDEPPPLEDTGGGKEEEENTDDPVKIASDTNPESQPRLEEWLDVLGIQQNLKSTS